MYRFTAATLLLGACITAAPPQATTPARTAGSTAPACETDNGGLVLPDGFCAVTIGSSLGKVRQIAVAPNGDLYAAVQAGENNTGGGVRAFRDTSGDGRPDETATFGTAGGNDVEVHDGYLYFAENGRVVRWRLTPGQLEPAGEPEVVVSELPADGGHVAKSLAFGGDAMYVNVGSRSNSCQEANRQAGSRGQDPCTELERRAGIWRFSVSRAGQTFADGTRSDADIVSEDPSIDIAVLRASTPPAEIAPAILGNPGGVREGSEAYAVGNPFGLTSSVSAGVISGLDRTFRLEDTNTILRGLIQIDAAVNPGISGGPLLNREGHVIGILTALLNPTGDEVFVGVGLAVPINVAGGAAGLPPY